MLDSLEKMMSRFQRVCHGYFSIYYEKPRQLLQKHMLDLNDDSDRSRNSPFMQVMRGSQMHSLKRNSVKGKKTPVISRKYK